MEAALQGVLSQIPLDPKALALVPILYLIGYVLKKTPKCPDWLIIWVLPCLGVLLGFLAVGQDLNGALQGLLAAGGAVASHQAIKQTIEKE